MFWQRLSSNKKPWFGPKSIRKTLFLWVLPTLFFGMAVSLRLSVDLLEEQAESAYDRTLAGVLQSINANISTEQGGLALEEPYRLLEFFHMAVDGQAYYHVAIDDGLAEIGFSELPRPAHIPNENQIYFHTGEYLGGQMVRTATLIRPMVADDPKDTRRLIVQVGESLEERQAFLERLIWRSIWRDVFALFWTASILALGIMSALVPMQQMRRRLAKRNAGDLRPLEVADLPKEIVPLVTELNHLMGRVVEQNKRQHQFLHDASHQLRTPLSILKTQVSFALREPEPAEVKQALVAMANTIRRATRLTNQLLNLARVQHTATTQDYVLKEVVDLRYLLRQSIDHLEVVALTKDIHVQSDVETGPFLLKGDPILLQEAIVNLLDNALRYSPAQATVYISLKRINAAQIQICIEDEGAGMSERDLRTAGHRFRRGTQGKDQNGAGLGLAIVKFITELHDGQLILRPSTSHSGLAASLVFTLDIRQESQTES